MGGKVNMGFGVVFKKLEKSAFRAIFTNVPRSTKFTASTTNTRKDTTQVLKVVHGLIQQKVRLWLGISLRGFLNQRRIIALWFWKIQAPDSVQTGLVQTGSVQTGYVGNHLDFDFESTSDSTSKKENHYKSFLIIIKLLFQKLFLPYILI